MITLGLIQSRSVINSITKLCRNSPEGTCTQIRNFAARKGYREKREKMKVKREVKKKEFVPHNILKKELAAKNRRSRKIDDSHRSEPIDNVYDQRDYRWKVYPFAEAVQCHRETHHPDMYNQPNATLQVCVELNMQGEKQTRFVDNFTRIAPVPYKFDHGQERSIIAFSKLSETYDEIRDAGAQLVGGVELIKKIQNGELSMQDFQYVVAHPNILPELAALRGLLKRRFPNPHSGTLDPDLVTVAKRFINGISYTAKKDEYEKDFGTVDTVIGTLEMNEQHLEENFKALVVDINQMRPKRSGDFITRCLLLSLPSSEKLKVDHSSYIQSNKEVSKESDDVSDETVAAAN